MPSESERYEILDALLSDSALAPDVSLPTLATQTAALVASDLVDLVDRANLISIERVMGAKDGYGYLLITSLGHLTLANQNPKPKQGTKLQTFGRLFDCYRF